MMAEIKDIIAVLGATGQQGGSVVNTFLEETSAWNVRGVTRNPSSVKAKALAERGVEIVEADMSSPSSLDAAFQSATAVFAVSDFLGLYFDPQDKHKPRNGQALNPWVGEEESKQLKNVIDAAAKISTLRRFIFSSLSNATKWSKGKYTHVYHFDSKATAEQYGREQYPELWDKTSVLQAGIFLNFFTTQGCGPHKTSDGIVEFICPWSPDMTFPWLVPSEDTGPFVRALVQDTPGQNLLAYREWASTSEIAAMFSSIFGVKTRAMEVPHETFWADILSPGLVEEFVEFIQYWEDFGFVAQESPPIIHPLELQTQVQLPGIADWIGKQDWGLH